MKSYCISKILLIFVVFSFACSGREKETIGDVQKISINFDHIKTIDISDSTKVKIIPLETNDHSLLYDIDLIDLWNDKILVFNKNNAVVFDMTGKFLFNVGHKGMGPGEYQNITSFFVQDNHIALFDTSIQRILFYDANGNYISSVKLSLKNYVSTIHPIENTQMFIVKNKYRGAYENIPCFSILNNQYENVKDVDNRFLKSSDFDLNSFYSFQEKILYWEFLNDTIFSIDNYKELLPRYVVDFQDHAIPEEVRKNNDTDGLIEYINHTEKPNLATLIRYVQEDSLYIRFGFIQKEAKLNYVRYNKFTNEAQTVHIVDLKRKMSPNYCFLYKDNKVIFPVSATDDRDDNPSLVFIEETDFWN